jgi:hypothetical protein
LAFKNSSPNLLADATWFMLNASLERSRRFAGFSASFGRANSEGGTWVNFSGERISRPASAT